MTRDKTLGEIAYEAYGTQRGWTPGSMAPLWVDALPEIRDGWHAAAAAVKHAVVNPNCLCPVHATVPDSDRVGYGAEAVRRPTHHPNHADGWTGPLPACDRTDLPAEAGMVCARCMFRADEHPAWVDRDASSGESVDVFPSAG